MSRELYRGRSKKVQKMGRDGLVEQDRATGQEQRISQRTADVSFGPERREPERAAPPSQQREHQRRQYQQEVRQAEIPAVIGWEPGPEDCAPELTAGGTFSAAASETGGSGYDAPVMDGFASDGFASDTAAPDAPDAAPSMRGAADMPMMATPPAVDGGPVLVRLRGRRPDSGKKPESERNPNRQAKGGGQFRHGPGDREAAKADAESRISENRNVEGRSAEDQIPQSGTPKRQDGENRSRLKYDGEKRLSLREAPAHREGDSTSPSLRGAADKPLMNRRAERSPIEGNPPKFRQEPDGRLQFGGDRDGKPDSRQDARQDGRRRMVRQFAGGGAKDKPDRLHYEAARPVTFESSGAVPKGPRLCVVPEKEPFSDVPEDEEQQTETDAVEAALVASIPLRNAADALKPPAKRKERRGNHLCIDRDRNKEQNKEQEDRAPGNRRQENGEAATRRRGEQFRTEYGGAEGGRRPFVEPVEPETDWTPDAVDEGPEIAGDYTIAADFMTEDTSGTVTEPEEPSEPGDAEGRPRYDRQKPADRTASPRLKNDRQKSEHRADRRTPTEDRQRTQFSADASADTASTEKRPRYGRKQKETAEKVDWTPVDFHPTGDESSWVQPDTNAADMDAVPLYAEIDGQFVREEIIVEPAETEREFQRNRTSRRGANYRNNAETQGRENRADSAYTAENEPCSVVIEAEYTIVETPETASEEPAEISGEPSGKEAENHPPVQRMEDGARVRCDADWDNDSGSKNGKKKAEKTGESSLNSETKEAGKGRLRFGKDTSRVMDDSQITRKKKRLFFGIGKKAAFPDSAESRGQEPQKPEKTGPVQSESVQPEPEESVQSEPVTGAKNPVKQESGTVSQKRVSVRIKQRREARERGQGRPVENSPRRVPVPSAANRPLALPPAAKDRNKPKETPQTSGEPEQRSVTEDGELWTRTRRGAYGIRTADDAKDQQSRHRSGTDGADQQGQRRRQRLHFEDEPLAPAPQPGDEGYSRSPPRRTEDSDGPKPEKPARKPRLRFEDEQPDNSPDDAPEKRDRPEPENGHTNSGQTEDEQAEGDKGETSADGAVPPPVDGNSGDALPAEANPADGGGNPPGGNAAQKKPPTREDIQVSKAEKRVDRASRKLEKARSKLPAKRRIKLTKDYDEAAGKVKHRLQFEKEYLPEGASAVPLPLRGIGGAANSARVTLLLKGHQKIREVERDNAGVESAHKVELIAEQSAAGILRWNHNRLRSRPYRAVRQAERALEREQVNLEWRRSLRDHPELRRKHALAKWAQKQRIKRKYAAAAREAKKTQQHTQTVLNETGQIIRSTIKQIIAKKSVLATVALLALIVLLFSAGLTSCMAMLSSSQSSYISVSYMADEEDITEADLYYSEMETDLQIDIDNTESNHPGYDEYRYNVGQIAHSPFELLAYLSTKYNAFKFRNIKPDIEALFWQQYTLTRTVVVETRSNGQGGSYPWYVLVTTLTVRPLSSIASATLDAGEETTRYGLYMQTCGDRQAFGNPFDFAWLGRVSSLYGYRKHPMTGAKNLHRGVDIGAPEGTEIRAIQDGRVVTAGAHESYGLYVVIEGEKGYSSLYAHCSSLNVHAGQRVKRGDVIAAVGSTGDSTGAHLHLETKLDGEYLNPIFFVETGGSGGGAVPGGGVVIPDYPGEAPTDETFARMLAEAEKYLGYPYVWGGSNPSTSFDCSGFVSWVINHSGWNVGRLGAQGLCNLCTPVSPADARPGDLVFFRYTYNAPIPDGATHVGIYVGNNTMIHCGNPISYVSLNTSYWQEHFYLFGRLPTPG